MPLREVVDAGTAWDAMMCDMSAARALRGLTAYLTAVAPRHTVATPPLSTTCVGPARQIGFLALCRADDFATHREMLDAKEFKVVR